METICRNNFVTLVRVQGSWVRRALGFSVALVGKGF